MNTKRILIIQGHPDIEEQHLCHQLAHSYQQAAESAGHQVQLLEIGKLEFPVLRSRKEWESSDVCADIQAAQRAIGEAQQVVIIYPLWLGTLPALLKAFLEQVLRPGFAFHYGDGHSWKRALKGKSTRIIVTMGMPGWFYYGVYMAHSLRSLVRNILSFTGFGPNRTTVFGLVEGMTEKRYQRCMDKVAALGRKGV